MSRLKVTRYEDCGFSLYSNRIFRKNGLRGFTKYMLMLMLSLPEDWNFTIKGLESLVEEGKDAIMRALKELEEHGYLIREQTHDEGGQFGNNVFHIFEDPSLNTQFKQSSGECLEKHRDNPLTEKPFMEKPCMEKPYTENPHTVKPQTENPPQENKKKENIYITNSSSARVKKEKKMEKEEFVTSLDLPLASKEYGELLSMLVIEQLYMYYLQAVAFKQLFTKELYFHILREVKKKSTDMAEGSDLTTLIDDTIHEQFDLERHKFLQKGIEEDLERYKYISQFKDSFSTEQLETLYKVCLEHVPCEYAIKYTEYYKKKCDETSLRTYTTPAKRIYDCLKNDYDKIGSCLSAYGVLPEPIQKKQTKPEARAAKIPQYKQFSHREDDDIDFDSLLSN